MTYNLETKFIFIVIINKISSM